MSAPTANNGSLWHRILAWAKFGLQVLLAHWVIQRFIFGGTKSSHEHSRSDQSHLLRPAWSKYEPFDVLAFFSLAPRFDLYALLYSEEAELAWTVPDQLYTYDGYWRNPDLKQNVTFAPSSSTLERMRTQTNRCSANTLDSCREDVQNPVFLDLLVIPHQVYEVRDLRNRSNTKLNPKRLGLVAVDRVPLTVMMEPFTEEELQSLWDIDGTTGVLKTNEDLAQNHGWTTILNSKEKPEPHWKKRVDLRLLWLPAPVSPQEQEQTPYGRRLQVNVREQTFVPLAWANDFWLLERHYTPLDANELPELTTELTFNMQPTWSYVMVRNLQANWEGNIQPNIISQLHQHSRREMFMIKRIVMDTNPYFLCFSGVFMLAHSLFQILAFKNDVQFWNNNKSMEGLSEYSLVYNFVAEFIIALYLLDSQETSRLLLLEILVGLVISGWKLTRGVGVSLHRRFPFVFLQQKTGYAESSTKEYDKHAVKVMSVVVAPCCLGYCIYSFVYKKHKNLYSFVIGSLAGMVYSFGFVMMCPQLYINYKLKSVDHLPWRAMVYKSLNTFVDDIGAFVIDMPILHRLATFRDDVIFFGYLYQRWIYRVDKGRCTEWNPDGNSAPKDDSERLASSKCVQTQESVLRHRKGTVVDSGEEPAEGVTKLPTKKKA